MAPLVRKDGRPHQSRGTASPPGLATPATMSSFSAPLSISIRRWRSRSRSGCLDPLSASFCSAVGSTRRSSTTRSVPGSGRWSTNVISMPVTDGGAPARAVGRAIREQSAGAPGRDGRRHGRIVTVFSAKGGCGKTTLATNLGVALAERGQHEVCVVDLDLAFGDVAVALGLRPVRTIADAVPLADSLDEPTLNSLLTTSLARGQDAGCAARAGPDRVDPGRPRDSRARPPHASNSTTWWSIRRPRSRTTCSRSSTRPTSWP